jgi:hypothetical protein
MCTSTSHLHVNPSVQHAVLQPTTISTESNAKFIKYLPATLIHQCVSSRYAVCTSSPHSPGCRSTGFLASPNSAEKDDVAGGGREGACRRRRGCAVFRLDMRTSGANTPGVDGGGGEGVGMRGVFSCSKVLISMSL